MTKILLVEDDKSLREIYGVRLLAEGYDIVSAGDGEEALAMAIKEKPNLIVSDVMMPKISGFDMLDILRSTTETRDIKVIMMTALSSDDQRARGEQLGADRYLVKSQVGIEDVVRTVHEVLGDSGATVPAVASAAPVSTPSSSPEAAEDDSLPQPTAPFTSPRPATLGEDVVNTAAPEEDVDAATTKDQIEQELQAQAEEPAVTSQVDEAISDKDVAASTAADDSASEQPAEEQPAGPAPVIITEHPKISPAIPATPITPATPAASDDTKSDDEDDTDGVAPLPPQPTIS